MYLSSSGERFCRLDYFHWLSGSVACAPPLGCGFRTFAPGATGAELVLGAECPAALLLVGAAGCCGSFGAAAEDAGADGTSARPRGMSSFELDAPGAGVDDGPETAGTADVVAAGSGVVLAWTPALDRLDRMPTISAATARATTEPPTISVGGFRRREAGRGEISDARRVSESL